jgi:hypothetical protein
MKPASANIESGICLPGEQSWELWKQSSSGLQVAQSGNSPAEFKSASVFGYPVSAAFAVPIRAATGDEELLPDIVDFQLEKQNLKPETPVGRLMEWRMVDREENNTLLLASVLNAQMADDLPKEAPQRFEFSPWLYYLPDDHLVIWKELGRLVFAVTRRDQPVYFHALNTPSLTVETAAEIEQLLMPLYTQGIITVLDGIVLWTEAVEPHAAEELARVFNVKVRSEKRPRPTVPEKVSAIEPVSVAMAKIRAARLKRVRNIVLGCMAAYLAVPAFFGVRWYLADQDLYKLKKDVNTMQITYGHVESVLDQHEMIDSLINPAKYPIELLNQVLSPLYQPGNQVRLKSVEIERIVQDEGGDRASILIRGESANAQSAAPATSFATRIKNNPALKEFTWAPPKIEEAKQDVRPFTLSGEVKVEENAETQ